MKQGAWRVKHPTAFPKAPNADGLLETEGGAIPVRIHIVQDGVTTGWDDGALGFDEGAVWFSGRACSFRVFAPDLAPYAGESGKLEDAFGLRHPTRTIEVDVTVLDVEGRDVWRDEAFLDGGLVDLRRRPTAEGESEYPPLVPRPGMVRSMPSALKWWPIALIVAGQAWFHLSEIGFSFVCAVAFLAAWGLRSRVENPDQNVLRRIEREERSPSLRETNPDVARYRDRKNRWSRR